MRNLSRRSNSAKYQVTFEQGWHWVEIIARTNFRRGDVVQRSPISRSYLGYWAYRIYRWMVGPLWIHIYIYIYIHIFCSGGGRRLPIKPYFFSFFLFPTVNIAQGCVYPAVDETSFLFLNIFFIQTPLLLSLNLLDNNIFIWYFPFQIVNICNLLAIILSSKTGWLDTHNLECDMEVTKCKSSIETC